MFGKARASALVFFVRFSISFLPGVNRIIVRFSHQLGVKANDCSLWLPGRSLEAGQKSRRFLRLFALPPGTQLHKAQRAWPRTELLFGFPPRSISFWQLSHTDLVESANYCSVICPDLPAGRTPGRCRASVSGFGVGVRCRNDCPVAFFLLFSAVFPDF